MRLTRRKDSVRLHLIENGPSIEGVLLGRTRHEYVLLAATVIKDTEQSFSVEGLVKVPVRRVEFYQVVS